MMPAAQQLTEQPRGQAVHLWASLERTKVGAEYLEFRPAIHQQKDGNKTEECGLVCFFFSSLHVLVVQLDATINTSEPGIVAA